MNPAPLSLSVTRGIISDQIDIYCQDANKKAVDLTGWDVFAQVRDEPEGDMILDLLPVIVDAPGGHVRIPSLSDDATFALSEDAAFWDLIFQTPNGDRIGPFLAGSYTIQSIITEVPDP